MSAMIRLRGGATPKKVFICYNFKQVRDAVLLLFFIEETKQYEKVFIYENANRWETDVLRNYTDDLTYSSICKKLHYLLKLDKDNNEACGLDVEKTAEHYSNFLIEAN